MSTVANPLAPYIIEAQHIVLAAKGMWANKADAIDRLADLLCSIEANQAFLAAGVFASPQPARDGGAQ